MATIAQNRKIKHDFEVLEKIEAGIVLNGSEVKATKAGQVNISGAYTHLRHNEAYVIGMHIAPWKFSSLAQYDPYQTRKLLLKKKELSYLIGKSQVAGLTIKPISVYTTERGLIKLEIGILRGKKKFDKRETIKQRDLGREARQNMKITAKRSFK